MYIRVHLHTPFSGKSDFDGVDHPTHVPLAHVRTFPFRSGSSAVAIIHCVGPLILTRHFDSEESRVGWLGSATGGKRRQGRGVPRIIFSLAILAASAVISAEPAAVLTERLGMRPF